MEGPVAFSLRYFIVLLVLLTSSHAELQISTILDDKPTTNSRVREVVVIGERHTGTNFLEQFIKKCIKAHGIGPRLKMGLVADKHKLQPVPAVGDTWGEGGVLVLGTSRNAYDWSHALWKTCYCCKAMQNMTYEQFVNARYTNSEWWPENMCRWPDVVYWDGNRHFKSVLESRQMKIQNLLQLRATRAFVGVEIIRLEDVWQASANGGSSVEYIKGRLAKYNMPFLQSCREEHVNPNNDARASWLEQKTGKKADFSIDSKVSGSILLSYKDLVTQQQSENATAAAELQQRVAAANKVIDHAFEASLGYGCVGDCTGVGV